MAISRTIVFAQGKGGVGKTTLTTNIGGMIASADRRVLIVDLDQQGNVARDLGFEPDSGEDLLAALATAAPLPIMRGVRPNLDVVPGGQAVGDVGALFTSRAQRGRADLTDVLEQKLGAIASDYDLIVIDTPPGDRIVVEAALSVASAVVIPTRSDDASIDGVGHVAKRFTAVASRNPSLRLAGVVLFATNSRKTRVVDDVRTTINEILQGVAPVFETKIRYLESAAADTRRRGLLIHELEQANQVEKTARLAALRHGEAPGDTLYSRNSSGLAGDYEALAREILARLAEIEEEVSVAP